MADNEVQITVTSKNETKAGFAEARADAEKAGDAAGRGFASRFAAQLTGGTGLAGLLFGRGGAPQWNPGQGAQGFGGFMQGITKLAGQYGATGYGLLAGAAAGVLAIVGNIATGLLAAGTALAAFGALAQPEFAKLLAAVNGGNTALQGLNAQQQLVVTGAQAIQGAYRQLAAKIAPYADQILGIFTQTSQAGSKGFGRQQQPAQFGGTAAGPLQQLLQTAGQLAQAVAPALVTLAKGFAQFVSSPGFKAFEAMLIRMAPGVVLAIGRGLGSLAIAVGKLLTEFGGAHGATIAINILFGVLEAGIIVLTKIVDAFKYVGRQLGIAGHEFGVLGDLIGRFVMDVVRWFEHLPGQILSAIKGLPGALLQAGRNAIGGFISGLKSMPVVGTVTSIVGDVVGFFNHGLQNHSPSRVMYDIGKNAGDGFVLGLTSSMGTGSLTARGLPGGGGGGVVLQITPGGSGLDHLFIEWLKNNIRVRGGGGKNSVQIALGQAH